MAIQPPPVSTGQIPSAQAGFGQINPFAQGYGQQFGMGQGFPTASPAYGGQYTGQYGAGQITPQDFWNCVGAIVATVAPVVIGMLQANPQLQQNTGALYGGGAGQMRPQDFWSAMNGISGGLQQGLPIGGQQYGLSQLYGGLGQQFGMGHQHGLAHQLAHQYGLGHMAAHGMHQAAMYPQGMGQISPQDFWNNFGSIVSSVAPIAYGMLQQNPQLAQAQGGQLWRN